MMHRRNHQAALLPHVSADRRIDFIGFFGAFVHDCGVRALRWFAVVAWFGGLGGAGCSREPAKVVADASAKVDASDAAVVAPQSADASRDASARVASSAPADADAGAATATRPSDLDVIVISVDSLRADMPWAGYPRDIAPRLTELEKRSVSYTRAYSMSSYTSMSLGGLLGGKLPSEMKRSGFFFGSYATDNVMFPELLKAKGVRTMSAHAHGYFSSAGFDQGFDVWQIVPGHHLQERDRPERHQPAARGDGREDPRRPAARVVALLRVVSLPRPARPVHLAREGRHPALRQDAARPLRRRGHVHRSLPRQAARLHRDEVMGQAHGRSS